MSAPYMQLYVADYLGDTRHLTTEQHGAYLLLLMTMWRSDGVLSDDPAKLARIAGLTVARWKKISDDILAYFTPCEGGLTQARLAAELTIADEKSEKRSQAGKAGGRAKALKDKKAAVENATPSPQHSPEPEPLREATASLSASANPTRTEIARGFVAFWAEYPKRVGKDAAAKSFERAMRRAEGSDPLETIMAGLRRALPGWDDPQFIPNPATWLNQGRWTDETPPTRGTHDRPANDRHANASHAQPSRAERDQSAALHVLARRGLLPGPDQGGGFHDGGPPGAKAA